ncbi:hypothetical protein ALC56_13242 [Trachymyrmex septentrionalis]|uniref:Uncharacterized protein n=1 Tax=Trachymyrmex septentrionalis TaxID=34720 RepID=A0A195EVU5_9HYME|nr:hypothetical protein ALC56_13242 [Trachymyrmex septentrionalis]
MVVDPTTLLPVVSGALSKNPSENREALVDVVVSCGTSEGKGSCEILHKVAYVTVLSNPWQTALICSVESFTSFRPKRNAPRDHEANRNWLRDIPRECENRREMLPAELRHEANLKSGITRSHTVVFVRRVIKKFVNSQERRSLRYKWLSTQHIYRSIVRGLRPFANAAGVDVAKMNDPPFFKKDPQRGPEFTEKVVAMSLINASL